MSHVFCHLVLGDLALEQQTPALCSGAPQSGAAGLPWRQGLPVAVQEHEAGPAPLVPGEPRRAAGVAGERSTGPFPNEGSQAQAGAQNLGAGPRGIRWPGAAGAA